MGIYEDGTSNENGEPERLMSANGWQPIETAPKNTYVLIYSRRPSRHQVGYDIAEHQSTGKTHTWYDQSMHEIEIYDWEVTHWMPLPTPPSVEAYATAGSREGG